MSFMNIFISHTNRKLSKNPIVMFYNDVFLKGTRIASFYLRVMLCLMLTSIS